MSRKAKALAKAKMVPKMKGGGAIMKHPPKKTLRTETVKVPTPRQKLG